MLTIDTTDAHLALAAELSDRGWIDAAWDERAKRIASHFATALGEATEGTDFMLAVQAARAVALDAAGDGPALHGEIALAAITTALARELAERAVDAAETDPALAWELGEIAARLARAALGQRRDLADGGDDPRAERVVIRARQALSTARDRALAEHPARGFATACFDQLSHALSLFADRERDGDRVVIDALRRADSIARRNGVRAWLASPATARAALVRLATAEAASALASSALDTAARAPDERAARRWLATTALRMLAGAAPFAEALAPRPEPVVTDPIPPLMEPTMKDTHTTTTPAPTLLRTLHTDATDAAWRTAGTQFVKLARDPLVALLARHLGPDDESLRGRIAAFLDTEIGAALLAAVLSAGLSAVPATAGEVPQKLARELRVRAMSDAGDLVADVLMGPLREVMALYLRDVGPMATVATAPPALDEPAIRIAASASAVRDREAANGSRG